MDEKETIETVHKTNMNVSSIVSYLYFMKGEENEEK